MVVINIKESDDYIENNIEPLSLFDEDSIFTNIISLSAIILLF